MICIHGRALGAFCPHCGRVVAAETEEDGRAWQQTEADKIAAHIKATSPFDPEEAAAALRRAQVLINKYRAGDA